ncbi:hypothetical protein ACWCWD_29605 [Streptomyces sp. NPDC001493]
MARRNGVAPPPQYLTAPVGIGLQVVDQLHGYALSEPTSAEDAQAVADELNRSPEAVLTAVHALDKTLVGPAAEVLRSMRRYGYRWSLDERAAADLHGYQKLEKLAAVGHLAMVWSLQGAAFFVTPERYRELEAAFRYDSDGRPRVPASQLGRRRQQLEAMADRERYSPCELHGISTGSCGICGPKEAWQCDWGACWANAVTVCGQRRMCERDALHWYPKMHAALNTED